MRVFFFLLFCFGLGFPVASLAQWELVQGAQLLADGCVRLTPATQNQRGGAWNSCQLNLEADADLQFTVNFGTTDADGADGMVFVLQPFGTGNFVIGSTGGSIGYENGPFNPSLAVEMDTWQNADVGDPWYDHIALASNGSIMHNVEGPVQAHETQSNIETGQDYPFRVTWNAEEELLEVYFAGSLRLSYSGNIVDTFFGGNPLVHWGFVASTGGAVGNEQRFCLVDADFATHVDVLSASPEGPWEICQGEALELTALASAPATSAAWSDTGTAQNTVTSGGEYTLVGEDFEGCPATGSISVSELPGPDLALLVDPNLVVCDGAEAELLAEAAPGATVAWDGEEGLSAITTEEGPHEVVASLGGCESSLTVDVLFQTTPSVSFAQNGEAVSGTLTVCEGEVLTLDAVASGGGVAAWSLNNQASLAVGVAGTYQATASMNGCDSDPSSIAVEVLSLPEGAFTPSPNALCWETTGSLGFNVLNDADIDSWELPSGTSSLNQAGQGTYLVHLIHDNGCESTESFNYSMLPPIATGLVNPEPLCDEGVAMLSVTGNVDALTWNVGGNGANLPVVSSMGEGPFVAQVTLGQCTQSDTAFVTWWPTPTVGTQPDSVSRCVLDAPYSFVWPTQGNDPVGTWIWSVNNEPATAGYSAYDEGEYTIEVRDNATGCMDTHTMHVEVLPNLNVVASAVDPLICMGDSTEVRLELLPVLDTDPYEVPFSLTWSTEGASGMSNNVAGGEHFITATNVCGSSTALAEVEEEYCGCHVWIPNAFTPDDDGLNEGFRIVSSCEWDAFSFQIFNRWGEQVWSTNDPNRPWDGGAPDLGNGDHYLPDGWYPYIVQWEYREDGIFYREQKTGRVLIVR